MSFCSPRIYGVLSSPWVALMDKHTHRHAFRLASSQVLSEVLLEVLSEMASKGVLSQVLFQPRRTAPLGGPHLVTNEEDGVNAWPFCPAW